MKGNQIIEETAAMVERDILAIILRGALSPHPDERIAAEKSLNHFQYAPQHLVKLLQIIVDGNWDMAVRQVASIHFKNFIGKNWAPHDPGEQSKILPSDKDVVRQNILNFIAEVPQLLRVQLGECLKTLIHSDYPEQWPLLLQWVTHSLQGEQVYGPLFVLRILSQKYVFKSDKERTPVNHIVEETFPHLLNIFSLLGQLTNPAIEVADLIRLICKIFWSSICLEIPKQLFDPNVFNAWMVLFLNMLERPVPSEEQPLDPELRKSWGWWKVKKWTIHILNRLYTRFDNLKLQNPDSRVVARMFQKNYAEKVLECYMYLYNKRYNTHRLDGYLPDRVLNLIMQHLIDRRYVMKGNQIIEETAAMVERDVNIFDFIDDHLNRIGCVQRHVARMDMHPDTVIVHFRDIKTRKNAFYRALKKSDPCNVVVEMVASQLRKDTSTVRLRVHDCFLQTPEDEVIDCRCSDPLWDKLVMWDKVSDILYYEVLDQSVQQLEKLRSLYVECGYPRYTMVKVLLPKSGTVAELLTEVKGRMKASLSNPDAELRLLGIAYGKICQILRLDDKIENIPNYPSLRAEEIPGEEKNLDPCSTLIRAYHFTKENATSIDKKIYGSPFLLLVKEGDKLVDVKKQLVKKLNVEFEELSKWKFLLLSLTGSKNYIEDNDDLWSSFEEKDAWVQLGLEHSEADFYRHRCIMY